MEPATIENTELRVCQNQSHRLNLISQPHSSQRMRENQTRRKIKIPNNYIFRANSGRVTATNRYLFIRYFTNFRATAPLYRIHTKHRYFASTAPRDERATLQDVFPPVINALLDSSPIFLGLHLVIPALKDGTRKR